MKRTDSEGEPVRGERKINEAEAVVVRRIFREFAAGKSPRAIATDLNRAGIPGPFGHTWGDTTIRGHACRGNGIVNNELYAGVLVWNRQRFIKDPNTGKRVSRPNPEAKWIRTEVPELRIVDDELWQRVKLRQAELAKQFEANGEAREDIRSLIGEVVITPGEKRGESHATLRGELVAILDLAAGRRRSPKTEVITKVLAGPALNLPRA